MIDIALLIAITIGLTELIKRTSSLDNKFLPLVSLFFGLVISIVWLDGSIKDAILNGIIVGLSASGLFDHTKVLERD